MRDLRADESGRIEFALETSEPQDFSLNVDTHSGESRIVIEGLESYERLVPDCYELPPTGDAEVRQELADHLSTLVAEYLHDLKTPLAVARSQLTHATTECDSDHLDTVETALARIDEHIQDFFALTYHGEPAGPKTQVVIDEVVTNAWETADTRNARIHVEDSLGTVSANEHQLCRLFENLFANAVQHNEDSVTVRVGRLDSGHGFFVADDGTGIPDDDAEAILEPGVSRSPMGPGLGLGIVTQIIDQHGWDLAVTTSAAGGARFEIRTTHHDL